MIIATIREIISEKEARRRELTHALFGEICARLSGDGLCAALQRLVAAGKIEEHPTIRGKSYAIITNTECL